MTRDDIIRMARQVWPEVDGLPQFADNVERFAAAIEEHLRWDGLHSCHPECDRPACVHTRKAVEAEREACAKICDELADDAAKEQDFHAIFACESCGSAIRERGRQ